MKKLLKKICSELYCFYDEYLCVCGRFAWVFLGLMHLIQSVLISAFLSDVVKKLNPEETKNFIEKNLPLAKLFLIGIKRRPISLIIAIVGGLYLCTASVGGIAHQFKLPFPDLWLQLTIGLASFCTALWWSLEVCRGMVEDGSLYRSRFSS